ncbi:MAG TPA: chloride channel protein [Rhizomicrobium sp.]|jgi:CIC family chloride channel protein
MTADSSSTTRPIRRADPLRVVRRLVAPLFRELRSNEMAQIAICAVIGSVVGLVVDLLHRTVQFFHESDFSLPHGTFLSTGLGISHFGIVLVPPLGGLLLGLLALWVRRRRSNEIVDPVEANALYGGRMSFLDSVRLTVATVISNAAGASLGMEAGYSQIGASIFSSVGQYFRLRRGDERVFVTAGAGAAIAAAFNAPFAGAFYGFELILAQYAPRALAPVAVATVTATLTQRALSPSLALFRVQGATHVNSLSYALFAAMGVLAAGVGILAMMGVTWTERGMRRIAIPDWLRPAIGGVLLSAIAFWSPQVLGSGHGAIQYHFDTHWALTPLALLLGAKLVASAVSVGSGFRGGLFSSSLFIGCVFGAVFIQALLYFLPNLEDQYNAFMLVGMASVAAAIIGAPLTMIFLVLEGTGDFPLTIGVLIGVIVASTIVRLTFGYSFSTWRFHQRGIGIQGAHDIGWISDLTVSRMMRSDPQVVSDTMTVAMLRRRYPAGSVKLVFLVADDGTFKSQLELAKAYDASQDANADKTTLGSLVKTGRPFLVPGENVRDAMRLFEQTKSEALPVLESRTEPKLVGYLTEAFALRRYAQELERRRSAEMGDQDLFSINTPKT